MKLKIEFDYFGNYHRASAWLGGKHIVGLGGNWEAAELVLRERIRERLEAVGNVEAKPPENKEIEI